MDRFRSSVNSLSLFVVQTYDNKQMFDMGDSWSSFNIKYLFSQSISFKFIIGKLNWDIHKHIIYNFIHHHMVAKKIS